MGKIGLPELLIILAIVVLIFGTKKLKNMGQDLGGAVKGFKDGMKDGASSVDGPPAQVTTDIKKPGDPNTVDVEAKNKS